MQNITNIADLNEINCLEYNLIKLPYEILNKKFRASQKSVDQYRFRLKREICNISDKFKQQQQKKNEDIPISEVILKHIYSI